MSSAPVILIVVTIAALLSLVAIVEPLATVKQATGTERIAHFALAALTLGEFVDPSPDDVRDALCGHVLQRAARRSAGAFSETPEPVFWDFAYFSFTIAAACQTADVRDFERRCAQGGPCAYVDLVSIQSVDPGIRDQRHRGPHRRKLSTLARMLIGPLASDPVVPQPLQASPVRPVATARRAAGVARR